MALELDPECHSIRQRSVVAQLRDEEQGYRRVLPVA